MPSSAAATLPAPKITAGVRSGNTIRGSSSPPRRSAIYVLSGDNEPRQVAVATGASDGKRTEILASGLEPGVQVITGRRSAPAKP